MTKSLIIVVALWTLVAGLAAWSSEKEGKKGAGEHSNIWMREKLESSKDILAGLATSDFKKINKQAKWMEGLSQLEEVAQANREGYSAQLQIFHFANRELIRLSEAEDIDGTALAYVQLTLSCVNCHKYLRGQKE